MVVGVVVVLSSAAVICYVVTITTNYYNSKIIMQRLAKRGLASKAAKSKEHDEETINELKEAFKIFDSKNTGTYYLI